MEGAPSHQARYHGAYGVLRHLGPPATSADTVAPGGLAVVTFALRVQHPHTIMQGAPGHQAQHIRAACLGPGVKPSDYAPTGVHITIVIVPEVDTPAVDELPDNALQDAVSQVLQALVGCCDAVWDG